MNKCCDDRRSHNRAEALKEIPPVSLVCGGRFSWQEEKHFEMLLNEVPDEYKINYMFECYQIEIEQYNSDRIADVMETRCDLD